MTEKNNTFALKPLEAIKNELLIAQNVQIRNFPKSLEFPFIDLYKAIVTKIKSTTISSECVLYDSVYAYNITVSYWNDSDDKDFKNYWFIGQNGQGDYWITDINDKIYFYDHDIEEISRNNFADLNINFAQWLQFAYLNKQLDAFYRAHTYNKNIGKEYMEKLGEISKKLLANYPFKIE
jgi:hypothetical protein